MISEIRLRQFRSYLDSKFVLSSGVNVVVGPNASGKTNLLEAVMVVGRGGSYRAPDADLVMHNKNWARIDTITGEDKRALKISVSSLPAKELVINNKVHKRITSALQIPVVLFEPGHLNMLSGSPDARRRYIDGVLEQIDAGFKKAKKDYERVLRQRNNLLKKGVAARNEFFPWDVRLSQLAGLMVVARTELIDALNKEIGGVYGSIAGKKTPIAIIYESKINPLQYESQMLKKLEGSFELDRLRGYTGVGPHRDDLKILINNKESTLVASRGESRTIIVSLKALEADILNHSLGLAPIILLDDVFSELDIRRSSRLSSFLDKYQSLITTTDSSHNPGRDSKANIIKTKA